MVKFCENYFEDENLCTKWLCACGHPLGVHACKVNKQKNTWICSFGKCPCKEEVHVDFSGCKIECLFKIKIIEMEKENDKPTDSEED